MEATSRQAAQAGVLSVTTVAGKSTRAGAITEHPSTALMFSQRRGERTTLAFDAASPAC